MPDPTGRHRASPDAERRVKATAPSRTEPAPGRDSTLQSMIDGHKLRSVDPIPRYQQELINQCGETIAGAEAANTKSAKVAFNAAYDAMRLAVDAHMNATGYRVESGEGGHAHRVRYAELAMSDVLSAEDVAFYRAARAVRHRTEYPQPNEQLQVDTKAANEAIKVAKRFHKAVSGVLKPKTAEPKTNTQRTSNRRS
jgi:hypothetical protein